MARGTLFLRYIIIGFYAYTWYEHLKVLDQPGIPDEINFHKLWFQDKATIASEVSATKPVRGALVKNETVLRCMVVIGGFSPFGIFCFKFLSTYFLQ